MNRRVLFLSYFFLSICWAFGQATGSQGDLVWVHTIKGDIRPKSVVHAGRGLFFAQNMMYRHSVTVYDRNFRLLKTLSDEVRLSDFGVEGYEGLHKGAPVEAAATEDGRFLYVSNYQMSGKGFEQPGKDACDRREPWDRSFLYRIDLGKLAIDQVIPVGSVPKYVATTPNGRYVLVTNWCSGDLSIVSQRSGREVDRIKLGNYPRGIAVDASSRYAYISLMGDDRIAIVRLSDFRLSWIEDLERTPRHLCLDPGGRYLYVSLSRPGKVIKIDLVKQEVIQEVKTGREARSMVISPCGRYLYVVNYDDNTLTKVETHNMRVVHTIATQEHPIGVAFDAETGRVWVACYTGSIMVFEDQRYVPLRPAQLAARREVETAAPGLQLPGLPQSEPTDPHYFVRKQSAPAPVPSVDTEAAPVIAVRQVAKPTPSRVSRGEEHEPNASISEDGIPRFFVIVGSFESYAAAKKRIDELAKEGYSPEIVRGPEGRYRIASLATTVRSEAVAALGHARKHLNSGAWLLAR